MDGFQKITHIKKLMSLGKAQNIDEILEWNSRNQKIFDFPLEFSVEYKFDGLSLAITYENGNLYLLAFNFKYKGNSLFSFARIKKINMIYMYSEDDENQTYEVVYKLSGISMATFEKKEYETILSEDKNEITIKAIVENEFSFVQRLLLFGADFKIVSPHSFKEKLIDKIKRIQRVYENDEAR